MNCIRHQIWKLRIAALLTLLIFLAGTGHPLHAQTEPGARQAPEVTTQKWSAGFDNFGVPLNYTKSTVKWSVATGKTNKLTVTASLVGGNPNFIYQIALMFYCNTFPATFGQFPVEATNGGQCEAITRQGVTASRAEVEICDVLTGMNGNGSCSVAITPVPAGTYTVEFLGRDGAGCHITGGDGQCNVDYQSPGPTFGDATTITVP